MDAEPLSEEPDGRARLSKRAVTDRALKLADADGLDTLTRDLSIPASWSAHAAAGSTFTSISSQTRSATPSSRSSLLRKCQYSAIGVTPRSWASLRMVSVSSPSASASLSARSTTARLLSRERSPSGSPDRVSASIT
jgi:hypothetical protein